MVSFWPWKGDDRSAASFEKVLSSLTEKINQSSARNDKLRQNQRSFRVLWTLYTGFAWLIAALILTLVTGWSNWTALEYTGLLGGPVVIYAVRLGIDTYYNYRLSGAQTHLNDLYKQRELTIKKLKSATRYDSTQQLLDKYGGASPKQPANQTKKRKAGEDGQQKQPNQGGGGGRTGIPPPPTANIPGRQMNNTPQTPQQPYSGPAFPQGLNANQSLPSSPARPTDPSEEFAPNAFPSPPTSPTMSSQHFPSATPSYASTQPRWYDRLMDVVLGEDETAPGNRIVLICQNCRLVNGQAPPGARVLEDVGRWRCAECRAWNGVEKSVAHEIAAAGQPGPAEASRPPADVDSSAAIPHRATKRVPPVEEEEEEEAPDEIEDALEEDVDGAGMVGIKAEDEATEAWRSGSGTAYEHDVTPPSGSTRSKARQRKKL